MSRNYVLFYHFIRWKSTRPFTFCISFPMKLTFVWFYHGNKQIWLSSDNVWYLGLQLAVSWYMASLQINITWSRNDILHSKGFFVLTDENPISWKKLPTILSWIKLPTKFLVKKIPTIVLERNSRQNKNNKNTDKNIRPAETICWLVNILVLWHVGLGRTTNLSPKSRPS